MRLLSTCMHKHSIILLMTEKQQMPAKGKVTHARLCKFSSPFGVEPITCVFALTFRLQLFTRAHAQHLNFVLWVFRDSVVSRIKSKHLNHQGSDRIGWCWKTFFFFFFKIWHCAKVYFCWRDGRRAWNPAAAEMSSTLGHPVILWLTITSV